MEYPATTTMRARWKCSTPCAEVRDAGGTTVVVGDDPGHHGMRPDLGPVRQGVGNVGDQRGSLGVHLAALEAESPVDAMGSMAEAAVGDGHRTDTGLDAEGVGPADEHLPVASQRLGRIRVPMRIAPRPRLTRDRELFLDGLVVGLEILVANGPVGADPVTSWRSRSRRGENAACSRRSGSSIRPTPRPELLEPSGTGSRPADDPWLGPIEVMRTPLVADPVGIGIPKRAGVESDDRDTGAGQPLDEGGAPGATADDDDVDLVASRRSDACRCAGR